MITDTTDIEIIRQSEIGVYDTARDQAVYSCNGFVRLVNGTEFRLHNNEKLVEKPTINKEEK